MFEQYLWISFFWQNIVEQTVFLYCQVFQSSISILEICGEYPGNNSNNLNIIHFFEEKQQISSELNFSNFLLKKNMGNIS